MNVRLNAVLADTTRIKLLWLRTEPAYDILRPVLDDWLEGRLALE